MKAFCLAFAFLLASLPATAEELPQTSNAWRASQPDMAGPGSFQWTVVDNAAGGANASAAANDKDTVSKSAPARAALGQIRAETQRVLDEARRAGARVSRIRYDLRVRCLVEEVDVNPEAISEAAAPYIWGAREEEQPTSGTLEFCEVDYSQKVRSQPQEEAQVKTPVQAAPQAELIDFKVAFPVD